MVGMKHPLKDRYLTNAIGELALKNDKMAFITGPRQCGKTTLCKYYITDPGSTYYTWDDVEFRRIWTKTPKSLLYTFTHEHLKLVIFDEIHKAPKWKQTIKGIYDTRMPFNLEEESTFQYTHIFVTGSARLNIYKKGGDSLMGRYILFRLHPFSLGELYSPTGGIDPDELLPTLFQNHYSEKGNQELLDSLLRFGGFPEPFLQQSDKYARIWRRSRLEKLTREDLRDLSRLPDIAKVESLTALLPERVGSPLSIPSLSEDLEVAYDTTKRWLTYLSELYYHFELKPWSKKIQRSLKKEGKAYLWDWSEIEDSGAKFENLIACHLLKACHFWTDTGLGTFELHYLKNKEKKEIDFLIVKDKKPWLPIECKLTDTTLSSNFSSFISQLGTPHFIQLTHTADIRIPVSIHNATGLVLSASTFLKYLP